MFEEILQPNTLSYNAIIRGYAPLGCAGDVIGAYFRMRVLGSAPDNFIFPFVLKACAELLNVCVGRCVHSQGLVVGMETDLYVVTSLIDNFVKCGERLFDEILVGDVSSWNVLIARHMKFGEVELAVELFDRCLCRNVVFWTAMISGFTQNGLCSRALGLFREMVRPDSDVKPNWVTVMSMLPACVDLGAFEQGLQIHRYANRFGEGEFVGTNCTGRMYAKCGNCAMVFRSNT